MIVREEIIGDCRLILGDSLEVLPSLGPVGHIITDPPYEDELHKAMACERIAAVQKQPDMFNQREPKGQQLSILDGAA